MCDNHSSETPQIVPLDGMDRRELVRRLWAGTMVLGVATSGCASVSKFFEPTDDQLIPLAADAWTQTKRDVPISTDARANARLQAVGQKIAAVAPIRNASWEYVVFNKADLNAFVLPGGKVGFYKGLMDFVDNDAQIAAVVGHETGHVVARHAARRQGREGATQAGLALGSLVLGGVLKPGDQKLAMEALGAGAVYGVSLPFSRENESEADRLGVDYMHAAGYDVTQAVRLWEKMSAANKNRPQEWMSTHPDPDKRAAELKAYINAKGWAKM